MLENKRLEKEYDWLSNVSLPELSSIILTSASNQANQLFRTRDFVEVKLSGTNPGDERKCQAAKLTLNNTLNRKDLYHYQKYMRLTTINLLHGNVYCLCGWDQETRMVRVGEELIRQELDIDEYGNPLINSEIQNPAIRYTPQPVYKEEILKDHFTYEVFDPRNVFTDNKYTYSAQEKDWITFRDEVFYDDLKRQQTKFEYFNLDIIKKASLSNLRETDVSRETYNNASNRQESSQSPLKYFERFRRYGKFMVEVVTSDQNGYPDLIKPGYDELGEQASNAELMDTIITVVIVEGQEILIGFAPNRFRDTKGNTYKPIVRTLCYIHPTKDTGLCDGILLKDLQIAVNDSFNIGADRTRLATLPVFQIRRLSAENNPTLYIEPEHFIEVENMDDVKEIVIRDDIAGTINLTAMLTNKMQQVSATYPTTMGDIPTKASTTATAIAGAESRGDLRANYKSLTIEYTLFPDFYWFILQGTAQFARKETAIKLMGEEYLYDFDPDQDYTYSPITSQIEQEHGKYRKLQNIDNMISRVAAIPNPNTPKLLNYLLSKAFDLMGDQFPDYKKYLLDESYMPPEQLGAGGVQQPRLMQGDVASNQNGMPQSMQEQSVRSLMNV